MLGSGYGYWASEKTTDSIHKPVRTDYQSFVTFLWTVSPLCESLQDSGPAHNIYHFLACL